MSNPKLKLKELRKILASFGVSEDVAGGKGSHTKFYKVFSKGRFSYPVPTHGKEVLGVYVKGCRRKFLLTKEDDVSDEDFYSRR